MWDLIGVGPDWCVLCGFLFLGFGHSDDRQLLVTGDLIARRDGEANLTCNFGSESVLHLHGLHDQQSLTSFDAGSLLRRQRDNRTGHRSLDNARAACIGFGTGGDYLGAGQYPGAVGTGDDVLFVVR